MKKFLNNQRFLIGIFIFVVAKTVYELRTTWKEGEILFWGITCLLVIVSIAIFMNKREKQLNEAEEATKVEKDNPNY